MVVLPCLSVTTRFTRHDPGCVVGSEPPASAEPSGAKSSVVEVRPPGTAVVNA